MFFCHEKLQQSVRFHCKLSVQLCTVLLTNWQTVPYFHQNHCPPSLISFKKRKRKEDSLPISITEVVPFSGDLCSHISPQKSIIDLVANSFRVMVIFTWGASYSVKSGCKSDRFKTSTSCYLKGGQCAKERRYQSSYIRQLYTELEEIL